MKLDEIIFIYLGLKPHMVIWKIGFMSMSTNFFKVFESLQGIEDGIVLIFEELS